jgi:sortase A
VTVLNETLYYRVDQILTVLPNETDALAIEKGKDYVTLVTCTPYGVNSHRLLVLGARIDYTPENGTAAAETETELSAWMKMPMQYRHLLLGLAVLAGILLLRALVVWMRKKFR